MSDLQISPFCRRSLLGRIALRAAALPIALGVMASHDASAQQGPLPVDVATPVTATIVDWDEFTGRFEAVERVELKARVSGFLQEVRFTDGQVVEKGDVLFSVDSRPFEAAYARAEAELQAARAEQTRASAELVRAEDLIRNQNVSESALDQRRAAKLQADAQVAIAEAQLREAALNLEFTEITAPFSGRISDSRVDVGNLVTAGETVLSTIVSTAPVHLVFTVSEQDFLKYARLSRNGSRPSSRTAPNAVQARLIDEEGWPHEGAMDFVANEFDPNAGTIVGRAVFENASGLLTPGLFARLRLIASGEYEAQLLPDAAIVSDQARKVVLVAQPIPEGDPLREQCGDPACRKVVQKVVTLGPIHGGLRVVRSGVGPDETVIVTGVQRARPGGAVIAQPTTLDFSQPASN
ncbi:MAG: efflux RND transporter periplasmic adaptor subunit [Pseudomonadota bacterium]